MEWMKVELVLSWVAVAFYCFSTVGFAWWLFFEKRRVHTVSLALGIAGFVAHSAALGLRWVMTGHGPYTTTYEVYSSNGWVIIALLSVVAWRIPRLSATAIVAIPLNILFLMLALAKYQNIPGLSTAFNYFWLLVHILFVKLAIAGIIIALGCSVFYLRRPERKRRGNFPILNSITTDSLVSALSSGPLPPLLARSGPISSGGATGPGTPSRPGPWWSGSGWGSISTCSGFSTGPAAGPRT